jgi:hypothetical protein
MKPHPVVLIFAVATLGSACSGADGGEPQSRTTPVLSPIGGAPAAAPLPPRAGMPAPAANAAMQARPASSAQPMIQTVITHPVQTTGVGGVLLRVYKPALLFDDGWASFDLTAAAIDDPVAERMRNSADWVQWQWNATQNQFEQLSKNGWMQMTDSQTRMPPLVHGSVLNDRFVSESGGGNRFVGGNTTLLFYSNYQFRSDSTFSSANSSISTVSGSQSVNEAPSQHGSYAIDGYLLTLQFADNHVERHSIVRYSELWFWIDGLDYCRQTASGETKCA